jgi:tetratricopeptide (TPR) repeat protein
MPLRIAITACLALALVSFGSPSLAASGDALIHYNLGLAAHESGDLEAAYKCFKKACLADEGLADACLAWAELAAEQENVKDVKRSLGSAVMLDPTDIEARYELAMMLIAKQDWVWAAEHLAEAVNHAQNAEDRALLRYYLGYVKFKDGALDEAAKQLALAHRDLPPDLAQRASYYRALIARDRDKHKKASSLFERAAEGPDEEIAAAAKAQLTAGTAFPRPDGFAGQLSASFGVNTHPSSSFLDDAGSESDPALQSVFRGDVVLGTGGYEHGFYGMFTAYREQNWTELGDGGASEFDVQDMNITFFMLQAAYVYRTRGGRLEHELRLGADGEVEFLDHAPEEVVEDQWSPEEDPFGLFGWALGGKLWWSMAADPSSIWSVRFKFDGRPNKIEADRSVMRMRLRLANNRFFLDRVLKLKLLAGGRYDRSYRDPAVIKYDRLIAEGSADLVWTTPWPRLSATVGVAVDYNWYLNSRLNAENSFRPDYLDNPMFSAEQNARFEADYYDLTRHDFEWELSAEVAVKTWWKAAIALTYLHHQRLSNLDEAPVPVDISTGQRLRAREYGYTKDIVMLEIRQRF